jgi:hypothetical protein
MTALPFSRAIVGHLLERLLGGLTQLQGAVLRALAEAQPPVFDATGPTEASRQESLGAARPRAPWRRSV